MNPIFEKINFCIKVELFKGYDENYYREKLQEDLREFLAPWSVGEYHKLTFGECVYRSAIIRFLETRNYIDFIAELKMSKAELTPSDVSVICPDTPRSILIAGDIEVCIVKPQCVDWNRTYPGCEPNTIIADCLNQPELVMDYCKPIKKDTRNGGNH